MSTAPSNIRVFIDWVESAVFAGEEIICKITFKNIDVKNVAPVASVPSSPADDGLVTTERHRRIPSQSKKISTCTALPNQGHRATLSLSSPTSSSLLQHRHPSPHRHNKFVNEGNSHRRSVSIISVGTIENGLESRKTPRGHSRSASVQLIPRKQGINAQFSKSSALHTYMQANSLTPVNQRLRPFSPSFSTNNIPSPKERSPKHPNEPNNVSSPSQASSSLWSSEKITSLLPLTFIFPTASKSPQGTRTAKPESDGSSISSRRSRDCPINQPESLSSPTQATTDGNSLPPFHCEPDQKSFSRTSARNFDSAHHPGIPGCTKTQGTRLTQNADSPSVRYQKKAETLMMGYAQLNGSFTLDSSLVNQTPFDGVKRKGAIGGQGGGVVGVQVNKRDSKSRGFGWGNIGDSIGDFLGSGELSSIKDLRGIVDSGPIPLLSTPQSILFVNLCLEPGESQSYMYSFRLPLGLPPSHRGKAIKISYKLVIGTQRPGGAKEQQVKAIEIPFRILGSVDNHGELLTHDLMSPYIILQEQASVKLVSEISQESSTVKKVSKSSHLTTGHFLSYVDELLDKLPQDSGVGPSSPTGASSVSSLQSEEPVSPRKAIDMAIIRSRMSNESSESVNKFEIARSGKKVAALILTRRSYCLGESVIAVIDFSGAKLPCYAIHAALESSEKIDASISLRAESHVFRLTRKTHVSQSESTLFSDRIVFTPTLPISATPEFSTSGVSLEWRIRVKFATPRLESDNILIEEFPSLLEELSNDARGTIFAPTEVLECETFEIAVPLRVYGAAGNAKDDLGLAKGIPV